MRYKPARRWAVPERRTIFASGVGPMPNIGLQDEGQQSIAIAEMTLRDRAAYHDGHSFCHDVVQINHLKVATNIKQA